MRYNLFIMMLLLLVGCEEKEVTQYTEPAALYFENERWGQQDSIVHSFFIKKDAIVRDTVWVDLRTMGATSADPRPVKIIQINQEDPDGAQPGVHYVSFDDPVLKDVMVINPHATQLMIPVILLRDASLKNGGIKLRMAIQPNACFGAGVEALQTFLVKTSDTAEKPGNWNLWESVFGAWSATKMKFIINYVGYSDFENRGDAAMCRYLQLKAREELEKYNNDHPGHPLCEDHDGTDHCKNCVVFP